MQLRPPHQDFPWSQTRGDASCDSELAAPFLPPLRLRGKTNPMTWATLVSKKPEEAPSKPAAPTPTAEPARNGAVAETNGSPAAAVAKPTHISDAPRGAAADTVQPPRPTTAPAAPPPKKPTLYEPAPNEIMRVNLIKPQPDSKLGIRLAGEDRPLIISLNPEASPRRPAASPLATSSSR